MLILTEKIPLSGSLRDLTPFQRHFLLHAEAERGKRREEAQRSGDSHKSYEKERLKELAEERKRGRE